MSDQETLDPEEAQTLEQALDAFNAGEFYEAHDHFEALWGEGVWKGFVQAAVALHHYSVQNPNGWKGMPENVHRILDAYRPAYQGLDIERFVREFDGFFDGVARGTDPDILDAPKIHRVSPHAPMDTRGPNA